ncbi:MAG TPA: DUF4097 family beta strand repeat-containing protein [Thermoanaerobaculia bacterium]|nr:DUF4097 family beta strand repeat-containing protein [Thermoanaerobaculia bacterium]
MKLHVRLLILTLVTVALVAPASAETRTETVTKTLAVSAGASLMLSNDNGGVTVRSWDRPEVKIQAEKNARGRSSAVREAMENLRVEIESSGNAIDVRTRGPRRGGDSFFHWLARSSVDTWVNYEITVPRDFDLTVETVNGGIKAADLSGALSFETVNGSIEVGRSAGAISASTVNGSIRVDMDRVDASRGLSFGTTNGKVVLVLPDGFRGDIDASTTNGSIRSDFPVTSTSFRKTRLKGSINGGGPLLRIRTTNGSITLERK